MRADRVELVIQLLRGQATITLRYGRITMTWDGASSEGPNSGPGRDRISVHNADLLPAEADFLRALVGCPVVIDLAWTDTPALRYEGWAASVGPDTFGGRPTVALVVEFKSTVAHAA